MQISSISANNIYSVICNKKQKNVAVNKQPFSDCFVKSNNISFSAMSPKDERRQKVDAFMNDMYRKVVSPTFNFEDVRNLVQKHSKGVISVKPMSDAPSESLFSKSLQGLFCAELDFDERTNRIFYPKKGRTLYVNSDSFKNSSLKGDIYANAVHEYTHALQTDDAQANPAKIFTRYIEQHKGNVDAAIEQVQMAIGTINQIEENIARPYINTLLNKEDDAYSYMFTGKTDILSWLEKQHKTDDFSSFVRKKVSNVIEKAEQENGLSIDRTLVYDTTINHFEREIEAYTNESNAQRKMIGVGNVRALTRVQIYQKAIGVLKEMKKEI